MPFANLKLAGRYLLRNSVVDECVCIIHLCMNAYRNGANNVEAVLQLSQPRWSKVGTDDFMC